MCLVFEYMESTMEKQIVESSDSISKVITLDDIIGKKENKKQEEKSPDKSTDSLLPLGMRETKKVNYIENPLPVPKRREHKEMSYAINELTSENDDYDVKDMTGMDFFDIE